MTAIAKLPANLSTERALLGALLLNGQLFRRIDELVEPEFFYDGKHVVIFDAFRELDKRDEAIDVETVTAQLRRAGTLSHLASHGSESYLVDLSANALVAPPVESYANILRRCASLRKLILFGSTVAEAARRDDADFDALYERASHDLLELGSRRGSSQAKPIKILVGKWVRALEQRSKAQQAVTGIPSGFEEFDEMTAGFQPTDLIIVAGRPSMGKTAFGMQICLNCTGAPASVPALVFSFEMSDDGITGRLVGTHSRIDSTRLRTGLLQQIDWARLMKGAADLVERRLEIDDNGALTLAEIRARARRWRSRKDLFPKGDEPGLILIDYLQLIPASRRGKDRTREQEVAEVSKGLKALAKELRVPVIALSQLNRGVDSRADHRPNMGDLRESGALEQDADVVVFLYRDEQYNRDSPDKGIAEVIIGKQRNGPTGTVRLHFCGEQTRFDSMSREAA